MTEDKRSGEFKYKACPFRIGHFCGACELLMPNIDLCVFKCLNANLGLLTKILMKDGEGIIKIKELIKNEIKTDNG